jgi:predicted subunit of tRNA(5-methylaminomethyl-2-thiouridylate) methyltransferase
MSEMTDVKKVEELLDQIQGVISSKVVMSDEGVVEELHLLTDESRNPKQISRDVQSACAAEFKLQFDHKVISIAQIDFTKDSFLKKRVKIQKVSKMINHDSLTCEVTLSLDEKEAIGIHEQMNMSSRRDYAVVMATIKALEKLFHFENRIYIEEIEVIDRYGYSVVIVLVSIFFSMEERLSGSSVITEDRNLSLVKATLDAVNRRINML